MNANEQQPSSLPEPTKSELEILQVLWQKGPSTVRIVNDVINEEMRQVNYTSTLKLMQIMLDKGLLLRNIEGKNHIYRPAEKQEITQTRVINGLANLAFGGSPASLVMRVLGNGDASPEELAEIKEMIQKMERKTSIE